MLTNGIFEKSCLHKFLCVHIEGQEKSNAR